MGVTYYKLEQRYEGDRTKGCGLTSAEVDANFHFLRGYDIKDGEVSEDGVLTLHRVDCSDVIVEGLPTAIQKAVLDAFNSMDEPFDLQSSTFDPETGTLTIALNGETVVLDGFKDIDFDFKLHVGQGLEGDGSKRKPIRLSLVNKTGFFAPVETVFDEENGEEYDGVTSRFITKEQVSHLGLLYDFDNAKKLDAYLSEHGNGWRIPTEEDWEDLFNAYSCDGIADQLKDESFEVGQPDTAFGALPIEFTGGLKYTAYWCMGESSCGEGLYKGIKETDPNVIENIAAAGQKNSIRLVKNNDLESAEVETICGDIYNTVRIGTLVWTTDNVGFENDDIKGTKPCGEGYVNTEDEYDADSVYAYFINEYDSLTDTISKKPLPANSVVMIHDYSGRTDEEWVVREENGVFSLKSRNDIIKEYIDENVGGDISTLTEITAAHQELIETLSESAETLNSGVETLKDGLEDTNENLSNLEERVSEHDGRLDDIEERLDGAGDDTSTLSNRVEELEEFSGKTVSALSVVTAELEAADENFRTIFDNMITDISVNDEPVDVVDQGNGRRVAYINVPVSGVSPTDKMLTLSNGELETHFSVDYNGDDKKIYFYGNEDATGQKRVLGTIPTNDFVKDGILKSADVVVIDGNKYIKLVFNSEEGESEFTIPVSDLVTEYTPADNFIRIEGFTIGFNPSALDPKFAQYEPKNEFDSIVGTGFTSEGMTITHKINEVVSSITEFINESQLVFTKDFKVGGIIGTLGTGKIKNGDTITAGTPVISVIRDILQNRLEPVPEYPSATIRLRNAGSYRVGDRIQPSYEITFNPGVYKYSDGTSAATNVSVSSYRVNTLDGTTFGTDPQSERSGSFPAITVYDDMNMKVCATVIEYTNNGYVPKDNLGENDCISAQIPNGTLPEIVSEGAITSFRPMLYGALSDEDYRAMDWDNVLDYLTVSDKEKVDRLPIADGAEIVVIMIPVDSNVEIKKIIDSETGFDLKDVFVRQAEQPLVKTYPDEDVAKTRYYVYVYNPNDGIGLSENTYKIIYTN